MGLSTLNMTMVGHAPILVYDLMWTCKFKGIMDTKNLLNGPYKTKNQVEVQHIETYLSLDFLRGHIWAYE